VKYAAPPGIKGTATLNNEGVAGTTAIQQTQQLAVFAPPRPDPDAGPEQEPSVTIFQSVPPGHCTVRITGVSGGSAFGGTAPIEVNGSDIAVEVGLNRLSRIEGRVQLPAGADPKIPVNVSIRGSVSGAVSTVAARGDGSFSFPNVMPGRFAVAVGSASGYFVTPLDSREGTVKDGVLEVPERATVDLSISVGDQLGKLSGFVRDGERAVEGVMVVLVSPPGATAQPGAEYRYRGFQTESDGSFNFGAIPAGRYLLFAVDDPEMEYAVTDVVAPYLSRAKEVKVNAGNFDRRNHSALSPSVPLGEERRPRPLYMK
jgi:hypothetical protein